jgi:hypothetical protein
MGFDLNSCNCKSCRADVPIAVNVIQEDTAEWYAKGYMYSLYL